MQLQIPSEETLVGKEDASPADVRTPTDESPKGNAPYPSTPELTLETMSLSLSPAPSRTAGAVEEIAIDPTIATAAAKPIRVRKDHPPRPSRTASRYVNAQFGLIDVD